METTQETKPNSTPAPVAPSPATATAAPVQGDRPRNFRDNRRGGKKPRGGDRPERVKPEFDHKIINIRRVTRVASGGRRFSFSVAVVAGNRKGSVGVGIGKAGDTSLAIDKATRDAKKHMIKVVLTPEMSISHPVASKYCSARVTIMPAKGRGLIAGSSVRNVLEFAGIKDVNAKLWSGSKNKLNNARAAIEALRQLRLKK